MGSDEKKFFKSHMFSIETIKIKNAKCVDCLGFYVIRAQICQNDEGWLLSWK